jgi:hypothetical protein
LSGLGRIKLEENGFSIVSRDTAKYFCKKTVFDRPLVIPMNQMLAVAKKRNRQRVF